MRAREAKEKRVCSLSAAADHFRVASNHGGAVQPHSQFQGISDRLVGVTPVKAKRGVREAKISAQEAGRFGWLLAFGWRQDS